MKPADLALVNDLFNCVAPVAAAEMKGRVLATMKEVWRACEDGPGRAAILFAMTQVEALPLSKETTT